MVESTTVAGRGAFAAIVLLLSIICVTRNGLADTRAIVVASTTSTENSGLFDHILPLFEAKTGIAVRIVAVGTGQAIRLAQRGDADVLLVHHRPSELAFVAAGYGVRRYDLMFNDFVIVGSNRDLAKIKGSASVSEALRRIAERRALFISRGDDSGTHKKEMALWAAANLDPLGASGRWYRETGGGMGATLNIAAALDAYALSDRATWLSFGNKQDLTLLLSGDPHLFNQYGVIAVNRDRHPHVRADLAGEFIGWLISPAGQAAIAGFRINGQQAFFPGAASSEQ